MHATSLHTQTQGGCVFKNAPACKEHSCTLVNLTHRQLFQKHQQAMHWSSSAVSILKQGSISNLSKLAGAAPVASTVAEALSLYYLEPNRLYTLQLQRKSLQVGCSLVTRTKVDAHVQLLRFCFFSVHSKRIQDALINAYLRIGQKSTKYLYAGPTLRSEPFELRRLKLCTTTRHECASFNVRVGTPTSICNVITCNSSSSFCRF